jgi:hypothetical protein
MSRRITALGSLRAENASDFGKSGIGARLASVVTWLIACLGAGGCLVTDNAQLEPVPKSPPIVLAENMYPIGSVIRVNASVVNEVHIPLRVRYENTLEDGLKTRFRVNTGTKIGAYACPEPTLAPTGSLIRPTEIVIYGTQLDKGSCSQVQFVVSTSFVTCENRPNPAALFDVTTGEDDEELGRATFFIWDTSTDPLTNGMSARALLDSCPAIDYSAPTTTPPPSMGTTP